MKNRSSLIRKGWITDDGQGLPSRAMKVFKFSPGKATNLKSRLLDGFIPLDSDIFQGKSCDLICDFDLDQGLNTQRN